jgi:hypothetical protein
LVVLVVAWVSVLPFVPRQRVSYDGGVMQQVAISIVDEHTPLVHPRGDFIGLNTPYSGYGLGTSLVMAMLYASGGAIGVNRVQSLQLTDSLLFAGTTAMVFVFLRRRVPTRSLAIATTALIAVGTPLLAYAVSDFSEPGVALMVAIGVLVLDATERRHHLGPIGLGAAMGGAILFRTDSWLLVVIPFAVALCALTAARGRALVLMAVGMTPFVAVWVAYNAARFGSLITSGYRDQRFSHSLLKGVLGTALSPGRGVLIYVPLLLLASASLRRQRGTDRVYGRLAISLLIARVLFYAKWWSWYGGDTWGPRFMVPALPAFALLTADALGRWWRRPIAQLAIGASLIMSIVGLLVSVRALPLVYREPVVDSKDATTLIRKDGITLGDVRMLQYTDRAFVHTTDAVMFDWSRFPFLGSRDPVRIQVDLTFHGRTRHGRRTD